MRLVTYIICYILFQIITNTLFAQSNKYYTPQSILKSYTDSTRSYTGNPGKNYWQNTADYNIDVKVNTINQTVEGFEEVTYYNNSPNTLTEIVIRLYADVYKKGNARKSHVHELDVNSGVDLQKIKINGAEIDLLDNKITERENTNLTIQLAEPLLSNRALKLEVQWEQKVTSNLPRRTGVYNDKNYFIGYWYPQVSVYDDLMGWDRFGFDLSTEFYNNLANFNVNISVPENYLVIATGTLKNANKVLPKKLLAKYNEAKTSTKAIQIIGKDDLEKGLKIKANTWNYKADSVTDFAIAATTDYLWLASSIDIADKKVFVSSVYPQTDKSNFKKHLEVQKQSLYHFSYDIPGIPYPYEAFTTFVSGAWGGGMEYPMMANNGNDNRRTTVHEIFHTFFPMYVRTNEKLWAWMDEGWAVFNTLMVENKFFDNKTHPTDFINNGKYMWGMGKIGDIPLMTPSDFTNRINYGYLSYAYSATFQTILQHYLGDSVYLKCYKEFIYNWAYKSPTPYDFIYTFEHISEKDLSWLIKPWLYEFGYADVAIKDFSNGELTIQALGNKPVPVFIEVRYKNDSLQEMEYTAGIWKNGNSEFKITIPDHENVKAIHVNKTIADMNPEDNNIPMHKSQSKLLIDNINTLGIDSALSLYAGWIEKSPNLYKNHDYKNSTVLKSVSGTLKNETKLYESEKVDSFISQVFPMHKVTIKVIPETMPKSGKIFISGNGRALGNWKADAVPMNKKDDGSYTITLSSEKYVEIQFKFTDGTWDTKCIKLDGTTYKTLKHVVNKDIKLTYPIHSWKVD